MPADDGYYAMWQKLILIALAGACGTLARYGLAGLVQRWSGPGFPWGTVAVNVLGCLLFGIVWGLASERWGMNTQARIVILVGFLGAFTTFSTFVSETSQLLVSSKLLYALGNMVLQNTIGIGAFFLGIALGRAI